MSEPKNSAIVEKYEAAGIALFITRTINGREKNADLTEFAFNNTIYNPDRLMAGLKAEFEKNLNTMKSLPGAISSIRFSKHWTGTSIIQKEMQRCTAK